MKQILFSLLVLINIPFTIQTMEKHREESDQSPLQAFAYQRPKELVCPLENDSNYERVVHKERLPELRSKMEILIKQISNSKTFFADVIDSYEESVFNIAPFRYGNLEEELVSKIASLQERNRNLTIGINMNEYEDKAECFFVNTTVEDARAHNLGKLLAKMEEKRQKMKQLMATQVALTFIQLDTLEKNTEIVRNRLEQLEKK